MKTIKLFDGIKATTDDEITCLYHGYANEWKHFDGFMDWVAYHAA